MPEVRFYHLTTSSARVALPKLLEKTLERGKRALVKCRNEDAVHSWNEHLWDYAQSCFLPHGSIKDPDPDQQPIFLTQANENPNGADYLFLVDGADRQDLEAFEICALLFDGRDAALLNWVRERWQELGATDLERSYWQQDAGGKWVKKR